ncbi:NAD(P)H-hydrate epimerase, partial [Xanthomonas citri pv. citri]
MTQYVCTAAAMRAAEQKLFDAHPGTDLMAVAAGQVAAQARGMLADLGCGVRGGSVLVLVGGGNNGGDGLLAAAELADEGCHVRVCPVLGTPHAAGWQVALRAGCE